MIRLMTLLSLVSISQIINTNSFDEFNNQVEESYDEYYLNQIYDSTNYIINTVVGSYNGVVRYGVYFESTISKDYYLAVHHNDKYYRVDENGRGDVLAVALNFSSGDEFSLAVFDKYGNYQFPPNNDFDNLEVPSLENFSKYENLLIGNGNGLSLTKLSYSNNLDTSLIIFGAAGFIIVICLLIIIIYFRKKKGMFSDDVRSKDVFNFREFLKSATSETNVNNDFQNFQNEYFEETEETQEETVKVDYGVRHSFSRDEDEESNFDLKSHLGNKGFILNYNILSEEEKNLITVELIRLKNENVISKNEYLKEISELWKN